MSDDQPKISMRDYIRRDIAHCHGIDREMLAHMDANTDETPRLIRSVTRYADAAFMGAVDWIIGNAPGALPHLRAAGIDIPDIYNETEEP